MYEAEESRRAAATRKPGGRAAPNAAAHLRSSTAQPLDDITGPRRGRTQIRHALTRYDGGAAVTGPDAIRDAILDGIGRGKSYGAGLLSIAPYGGAR
ncbi:type I-E CRISPR-associated protein Cas6/Cse3/CasE [Frankia canadensis]|uniref:type I-E CRISPR-associated protein Cas6/Cse3/CasE n=1 Tax=Frankia canadensis TaxID=1836972 RepID=UPI001A9CB359